MTSLLDLSNCPALEMVIVHSNQLERIEPGIGALQRLQYLDLANNMIHSLPEELSNATSLTYLNVRGNRLGHQIGRAHVCTPVTNAHLVSRHQLEKQKITTKNT